MISFTDKKLYVKGTCQANLSDPCTGDVLYSSNKFQTGKKLDDKVYRYHTGYAGGLKEIPYRRLMEKKADFAFEEAVRRMLPKGPLGYAMLKKLHVYAGAEHKHEAQKPEVLVLK